MGIKCVLVLFIVAVLVNLAASNPSPLFLGGSSGSNPLKEIKRCDGIKGLKALIPGYSHFFCKFKCVKKGCVTLSPKCVQGQCVCDNCIGK